VLADESTKSLVGRQGVFGGNTQGQDNHCDERRHAEGVRVNDIRTVHVHNIKARSEVECVKVSWFISTFITFTPGFPWRRLALL
jgi:hypothetical protein